MNRLVGILSLLFLVTMTGCEVWRTINPERDFSTDPTFRFKEVDFKEVLANPTAYRSVDIEFDAMMNRRNENLWEPYYSGMSEENYLSFSVWPKGAKLWTEKGWMSSVATMYINKESKGIQDFLAINRYDTIHIRGKIKSDFRGLPWVEVFYIWQTHGAAYKMDSLTSLVRGMAEVEKKQNAAAIQSLERALLGKLPSEAIFIAHYRLGQLYFDRAGVSRLVKDYERAVRHYGDALYIDNDHAQCQAESKAAQAALEKQRMIEERKREEEERKRRETPADGNKKPDNSSSGGGNSAKYDQELSQLRRELQKVKAERDRLAARPKGDPETAKKLADLQAHHGQVEIELKKRVDEVDGLTQERDRLKKDLAELQAHHTDVEGELKKRVDEVGGLKKEVADIKAAAGGDASKVGDLQKELRSKDKKIAELSKKVSDIESAAGGDASKVGALQEKLNAKDKEIAGLNKKVADLKKGGRKVESSGLKKEIADQDATIQVLRKQNRALQRRIQKLIEESDSQ